VPGVLNQRPLQPRPTGIARWLPGLHTLLHYDRAWLGHDLAAGLTLTAVLVPVGLAYAVASGLPGIHGLYATLVALLVYALVGPSRVLVLGPDSSLTPLILAVVLPLAAGDAQRAVALAGLIAVVAGAVCLAAGLLRLGFVTELLSKPIRHGYMNGIALTVIASQVPALFGFRLDAHGLWDQARAFVQAVQGGAINGTALALGLGTLGLMLALRRWWRGPGVLIAVLLATACVVLGDLSLRAGVPVLGSLPQGLPGWAWPQIGLPDLQPVLWAGLAVALVSFADTSVLSRSVAARRGSTVDANQELRALGATNLVTGLFQGFPVSASASRTPVAEAAGARTQLAGVVGAAAIAVLLLVAPDLLRQVPSSALAAVVIASALALVEVADLRRIRRVQPWEFWLSIGCLAGVALLGAIAGIGLAIGVALIEFLWDGWRPYSAVLGRVDGVKGYHDLARHPEARVVPGLVLFRWDAPLFFANAEQFRRRVQAALDGSPTPVRRLVVSAEPVTSIDVTSADMLDELDRGLRAAGIELCFAEVKGPVKDKLRRFGLFAQIGAQRFFPTLGEAVTGYLEDHGVDWVDWEDRASVPAD
jgi:high affinity sulfate transporter 1